MTFDQELQSLINRHSKESASDTPDFILAMYISAALDAFNAAVKRRDEWYGVGLRPAASSAYVKHLEGEPSELRPDMERGMANHNADLNP